MFHWNPHLYVFVGKVEERKIYLELKPGISKSYDFPTHVYAMAL
jgi:hypothetical protein